MTILMLLNGIAIAIIGVAALSLVVNPNARTSQVVEAMTEGFAKDLTAAKAF